MSSIGNSVPPLFMRAIAQHISAEILSGSTPTPALHRAQSAEVVTHGE